MDILNKCYLKIIHYVELELDVMYYNTKSLIEANPNLLSLFS